MHIALIEWEVGILANRTQLVIGEHGYNRWQILGNRGTKRQLQHGTTIGAWLTAAKLDKPPPALSQADKPVRFATSANAEN